MKLNRFGCVNVGGFSKNGGQCCSGICDGNRCREHDTGGCQVGPQDGCVGSVVPCATMAGACNKTTGSAPYCANDGQCTVCAKECRLHPLLRTAGGLHRVQHVPGNRWHDLFWSERRFLRLSPSIDIARCLQHLPRNRW